MAQGDAQRSRSNDPVRAAAPVSPRREVEGSLGIRNTAAMECGVCEQLLDDSGQQEDGLEIALFGAAKFAWCPACGRKVDASAWTAEYKERWSEHVARPGGASSFGRFETHTGQCATIMLLQPSGGRGQVCVLVDGHEVAPVALDSLDEAEGVAGAVREQLRERGFR